MDSADRKRDLQPFEELEAALVTVDQQAREIPSKQDIKRTERRSSRNGRVAIVVSMIIALLSLVFTGINGHQIADTAAKQALNESSLQSLKEANKKLEAAGLPPVPVPQQIGQAFDANALAQAAAALVLSDPRFAGLTIADLRRQVEGYFASHPLPEGQKPTTDQVTAAVAAIYAANPPRPGRAPTVDEIADAVSAYCAGNNRCRGPVGPQGETGATGQPAPPPTPAEIRAQVEAYCADNNKCQGPMGNQGPKGADGPTPTKAEFSYYKDHCNWNVTYSDGNILHTPVPDSSESTLCGAPPSSASPTSPNGLSRVVR